MEGIVGGSGYALSELEREFQAAVVHHQFEDRFRVDIGALPRALPAPSRPTLRPLSTPAWERPTSSAHLKPVWAPIAGYSE